MNKLSTFNALLMIVLCIITSANAVSRDTTVTGTVIIADENDRGEPTAISLEISENNDTEKSDYVMIVIDKISHKLLTVVGSAVEVTGKLSVDRKKRVWMTVKKYKVIQNAEAEEYPESEDEVELMEESEEPNMEETSGEF